MRLTGKRNTITTILWKSYLFMVLVSLLMIIVPCMIFMIFGARINRLESYHNCSAADIMQDDYRQIDVSRIRNLNGSVQIVTENLEVITLCGNGVISQNELSETEWTNFLIQSGGVNDIECDVLYNEKEKFWLIVELPVVIVQVRFVANKDLAEYDRIMRMLGIMIGSYFAIVCLCAVCYSRMTAVNFRKPFHKLCDYVNLLEQGHYEKRVQIEGIDELMDLERGMNHLAGELERETKFRQQVETNRNQLIRDISHDLKNPLMAIRGYAELCVQKEQITQQQMREYLELILQNSIRANDLLMSLFDYAKIESADFELHKAETDMGEFLRQELIAWIPELENRHFIYEADIPEKALPIQIDEAQMKRVFSNLFGNALKYNPEGTSILIALKESQGKYEILFSDNGTGMEEQYAMTIFDPFSRPDGKVRNSRDGGSGLGLAIVKKIITLHGGEITIETAVGKGTEFKIVLPI